MIWMVKWKGFKETFKIFCIESPAQFYIYGVVEFYHSITLSETPSSWKYQFINVYEFTAVVNNKTYKFKSKEKV